MMSTDSPSLEGLRDGVSLRAIANATMTSQHAYYASLLSWDCRNYVLNCGDGTYGAITFDKNSVVGVFFDSHSSRSPFGAASDYSLEPYFSGIPQDLWKIARTETLRYNRQQYRGELLPVITAAFWSKDNYLDAAFPWSDVLRNGAHIVSVELTQKVEDAIVQWKDAYQMSFEQVTFVQAIFKRRSTGDGRAVLRTSEIQWLNSFSESKEALETCLAAFSAMRITVENS